MLDDFREWLSDNLRYILLGLAVILVVIIAIIAVKLFTGGSSGTEKKPEQNTPAVQQNEEVQEETQEEEEEEEEQPVVPAEQTDLVKDDSLVLTLVRKHYEAIAAKDVTTLSQIVTPWNSSVEEEILKKDVIESYNDIATYSKPGLTKGSYFVLAYFKGKVKGFDEGIPSLRRLYLVEDTDGILKVSYNCDSDKSVADFITQTISGEDVQRLIAQVNNEYSTVVAANPELKAYLDGLESAASGEDETEAAAVVDVAGTLRTAMYDLNIREQPNTNCNILGTVPTGRDVTVNADVEDGWTNITFDAGYGAVTGYVRTEYLKESENAPAAAQTAPAADTQNAEASAQNTAA